MQIPPSSWVRKSLWQLRSSHFHCKQAPHHSDIWKPLTSCVAGPFPSATCPLVPSRSAWCSRLCPGACYALGVEYLPRLQLVNLLEAEPISSKKHLSTFFPPRRVGNPFSVPPTSRASTHCYAVIGCVRANLTRLGGKHGSKGGSGAKWVGNWAWAQNRYVILSKLFFLSKVVSSSVK